jgi:hypothetical protein
VFRSGDLTETKEVDCDIENCSKSGIYNLGSIDLDGNNLRIITADIDKSKVYNYTCIDFNSNNNFCEENEGTFDQN